MTSAKIRLLPMKDGKTSSLTFPHKYDARLAKLEEFISGEREAVSSNSGRTINQGLFTIYNMLPENPVGKSTTFWFVPAKIFLKQRNI